MQRVHADRPRHVVQIKVAKVHGADQRIGADARRDVAGHRDPAGLGIGLQPGRDIHRVAVDIATIHDDVADIHADAQTDAPVRHLATLGDGDVALNLQRARDRRASVVEDHQRSIAGMLDQGSAVSGNARFEFPRPQPHETLVGGAFVRRHEPAVPDHIGGEYGARFMFGLCAVHSAPLRA